MRQEAARAPGLRAEARVNRCAPCSGAHSLRGLARGPPLAPGRDWPARAPRGAGGESGEEGCVFLRPFLTFQHPRLAAPGMRPTRPPASRCGRPRGWARGGQGDQTGGRQRGESPLSNRAPCARAPRRRGRIPSPGLGAPSPLSHPRAGLEVADGSVLPRRASLPSTEWARRYPESRRAPHSPPGGAGTRRARPPPRRNELSTAALGAARGHAGIWRRAENREASGLGEKTGR